MRNLRRRYPPSVRYALRMWWQKHPDKWPYQVPEDLLYWLRCLHEGRRYYANEPRIFSEIRWYQMTLKHDKKAMWRAIAEFRKWAIENAEDDSSTPQ